MAEHDTGPGRGDNPDPVDEDAAWAAIVAGYDEEADPPESGEDKADDGAGDEDGDADGDVESREDRRANLRENGGPAGAAADAPAPLPENAGTSGTADPSAVVNRPLGSGITIHPVGIGPRDWTTPEPPDGDEGDHFVPPEPPPLPEVDTTTKFAWLAVLGGPLLLLLTVVLQWEMTWWILTLGIGGFLGGFATLVGRMSDDDDDGYDDPGRGAVV